MMLKSEIDGQMGPEDLDPRKSTCSLPTDTSQPSEWPFNDKLNIGGSEMIESTLVFFYFFTDFPYNKSASLPGYGRNGIYKVSCHICIQPIYFEKR